MRQPTSRSSWRSAASAEANLGLQFDYPCAKSPPMMIRRSVAALALAALCAACSSGGGSSAPIPPTIPWGSFRHDSSNSGASIDDFVGLPATAPTPIEIDGSAVSATAAIGVGGDVYVGTEGGTFAAIRADGTALKWKTDQCNAACPTLGAIHSSAALAIIRDVPTLSVGSDDGKLLVFQDHGTSGTCQFCFQPSVPGATVSFVSSPLVLINSATLDITAIILGAKITPPAPAAPYGKIYAVTGNGSLLWEYSGENGRPIGPVTSKAASATGDFIILSVDGLPPPGEPEANGELVALTTHGTLLWRRALGPLRHPDSTWTMSPMVGNALTFATGTSTTTNPDTNATTTTAEAWALTQDGRTIVWHNTFSNEEFVGTALLSIQLEPTETPTATAVSASATPTQTPTPTPPPTSTVVRTITATATATASPTISVTPSLTDSTLFAVTRSGKVKIITTRTGAVIDSDLIPTIEGNVLSSPITTFEGTLVFATDTGRLYALDATTLELRSNSPLVLTDGEAILSSPAMAADGTIWIGTSRGMFRIRGS